MTLSIAGLQTQSGAAARECAGLISTHRRLRPSSIACGLLATFVMSCSFGAEDPGRIIQQLDFFTTEKMDLQTRATLEGATCGKAWKAVTAFIKYAGEIDQKRIGAQGAVKFGFNGDETEAISAFKGNLEAQVGTGTYPRQVRAKTGASLRFDEKQNEKTFSEEVASILANYDYYLTPRSELYGFIERFTDSFVSIDQRYEIGLGFKYERTSALEAEKYRHKRHTIPAASSYSPLSCENRYTGEGCKAMKKLAELYEAARAELEKASGANCLADGVNPNEALASYFPKGDINQRTEQNLPAQQFLDPLFESLRKENTKFEWGFAAGVFAEFQQADTLDATIIDSLAGTTTATKLKPTAEQRYRLSLRPSLTWRLNDVISFDTDIYAKLALDEPRKVAGERDYRLDVFSSLNWALGTLTPTSKKKTSLALGFEWHYDNLPPDFMEFVAELPAGQTFQDLTPVPKIHRITKLQVAVEW